MKNIKKLFNEKTKGYNFVVEYTINGHDWRLGLTNHYKNWKNYNGLTKEENKKVDCFVWNKKEFFQSFINSSEDIEDAFNRLTLINFEEF